ncbi:MAG: AAA family ATPase, partial [Chloroflexi bacterium]|nr:AAA family ATPase [Chloroflexota bacterium]
MHLRALELHGFKTFATPTQLAFSPRITAIVGPNGAGKSNIVDALRWALGETSFQLLRARKTEDLIFAGAPGRPRAGMAAVTLVLDNHDGALPVDFTEVALTRRAYRDGKSEFLLNGQRVRLRDVKELLAQAGLSEGAHVFIGQGMVDAILALRPEDRRALFEEAAGIGLVRQRREEALRRLDATRRNMERAQDLLAELEPRLRRLERQVQRAKDLEALREDLRQHLRVWYGYRWQRAVAAVEEALAAHAQAQAAWQQAQAQVQALEEAQQARFERIRALREQRRALVERIREAQREWQAADRQRQEAEEQLRALEQQRAAWQAELTRARETLKFRLDERRALEEQIARLEDALREAQEAHAQAQRALEEAQSAYRSAQEALDAAR